VRAFTIIDVIPIKIIEGFHGKGVGGSRVRAMTIIDVLSIKIIDGKFAGRESVGRGGQSRHPAAKVLRFGADPEGWGK